MKEVEFTDALTEAEKACTAKVKGLFRHPTHRCLNPGVPDCQVFDIGYLYTGDNATFDSASYHWRGTLELYRRDRTEMQRDIMKILEALPCNADYHQDGMDGTNVLCFRVAPETRSVSEITTANINPNKDESPIPCFTCTVAFDVVFQARFE